MGIAGFTQVGIIGAGQMGRGIAQLCACHGLRVSVLEQQPEAIKRAQGEILQSVTKLHTKGVLTAEQVKQAEQISFVQEVQELARFGDCDLIIEAITEDAKVKQQVFAALDAMMPAHVIFASNTSSLPITELAAKTKRPERFIGMHFMNPVPLMQLVEVIPGLATEPEVTARIIALAKGLGKEVSQSRDFPGFVVNRILMPMINEAFTALMEGVASAHDIDKGMKLGTNQPMGPLALADFIGLDTCLAIMEVLHQGLGDPRYRPCPLLRQYVAAGWLGKKKGRGVYTY